MSLRTIFFLASVILFVACGSSDSSSATVDIAREQAAKQLTSIQWIDSLKDFGRINMGQKLAVSFRFKNTGDKPLVIESVKPACGCTVADYPKQPIMPGEEGEITGEFDSQGREGLQHKEITVTTNTPVSAQKLFFEVMVIAKPQQQETTN